MKMEVKVKVNPNAALQLAKEIERNLRKKGIKGRMSNSEVQKLQRQIRKLGS